MDDELGPSARRSSTRVRKVGAKVTAALTDPNARAQAAQARLDALESDYVAPEIIDIDDDEDASVDEDEPVFREKKASKSMKRKTRRAKAQELERGNRQKVTRTFADLLQEANLESLPAHVPSYLTAAVGPPTSSSRRYFCSVCGYLAPYTCTLCTSRFCSVRCKVVHSDTRCLKFLQ